MKLQVKIVSTLTRHGASPIKDSSQTLLAVKKSRDVLGTRSKKVGSADQEKQKDHQYGKHNGSVHVSTLLESEGTCEELDKVLDSLIPKINTFRNLPAINLREMKKSYGDYLDELTQSYDKKYGSVLGSAQAIEFTNLCASKAFKYYRHQIIIRFIGTLDEFEDKDRLTPYVSKEEKELFITEIKVKSVCSDSLLTSVELDAISNGSDKILKATSRDVPFTMELRNDTYGSRYKKIPVDLLDEGDDDV